MNLAVNLAPKGRVESKMVEWTSYPELPVLSLSVKVV